MIEYALYFIENILTFSGSYWIFQVKQDWYTISLVILWSIIFTLWKYRKNVVIPNRNKAKWLAMCSRFQ